MNTIPLAVSWLLSTSWRRTGYAPLRRPAVPPH